ncbi:MAG: sulfotransferase, partial [Gammaproteobacteria bacterium]|nr:sulfotransferase [Gammaproteobacteria bacterium]
MEALLEAGESDTNGHLHLCHALAKEHEDLGDYAKAFEYWERGKLRKLKSIQLSIADYRELFEAVTQTCSAEFCSSGPPGHDSSEPIFLVGMPRTGTTLVERILSSHHDVFAAGELDDFAVCIKRATATPSNQLLDVETIRRAGTLDFAPLGNAYIGRTRPRTGHTRQFIDKMPLNFLYAGLIHRALAGAKIICVRRNPLDTCLSNYRQLFEVEATHLSYSYDLMDTGHYYMMFDALIRHWQEVLGDNFKVMRYEDVVTDIEGQARELL